MLVHVDTNVYGHLRRREQGLVAADEQRLRDAMRRRDIDIPLSVVCLEETMQGYRVARGAVVADVRLILQLCRWDTALKPTDELLPDEMRAFLRGEPRPSPLFGPPPQMIHNLAVLYRGVRDDAGLDEALRDGREYGAAFRGYMRNGQAALRPIVRGLRRAVRERQEEVPGFDRYWQDLAVPFAEEHATRANLLDAFRALPTGAAALLDVRSVRALCGAALSLTYAHTFEGIGPRASDSRDLLHLTTAAAAVEVFVTHDARLRQVGERMPMPGFRVCSLAQLLAGL